MKYFDKKNNPIRDGDLIRWDNGKEDIVYLTVEDELGIDATNPTWIEKGKACPCEYGIYPFTEEDLKHIEVVESNMIL